MSRIWVYADVATVGTWCAPGPSTSRAASRIGLESGLGRRGDARFVQGRGVAVFIGGRKVRKWEEEQTFLHSCSQNRMVTNYSDIDN